MHIGPSRARPRPAALLERLRSVQLEMLDAVRTGDGLEEVARLAAAATGGPVAIVAPRLGAPAASGPGVDLGALGRYVHERLRGRPVGVPPGVVAEAPIGARDEPIGAVLLHANGARPEPHARRGGALR